MEIWISQSLFLLLLTVLVGHINCFKLGAGDSACQSMVPGHYGTTASTDPSPFYIELSQDYYEPGEEITGRFSNFVTSMTILIVIVYMYMVLQCDNCCVADIYQLFVNSVVDLFFESTISTCYLMALYKNMY